MEREHSFYLRGSDGGQAAPSRCVELYCGTQTDKMDVINKIWRCLDDAHQRKCSFTSSPSVLNFFSFK